jgi:hypothetical protein
MTHVYTLWQTSYGPDKLHWEEAEEAEKAEAEEKIRLKQYFSYVGAWP